MSEPNDLGEGSIHGEAGEPEPAPPPEQLWVRATGNLNVGGDMLRRGVEYLVDPSHPKVAMLLAAEPPWLLPLPGQGWGDRVIEDLS